MAMKTDFQAFYRKHVRIRSTLNERHIKYTAEELKDLIQASIEIFKTENALAEMTPPCVIVGDIHGQYQDLMRMFSFFADKQKNGKSGALKQRYVFLGDYVDRGRRSLECVCFVLCLKVNYPKQYIVLRDNHECKAINRVYGFYDEIIDRFEKDIAETIWLGFNEVFSWMPLAGIIGGKILCMHGGISAALNTLDDIRNIPRPLDEPNANQLAMDLLWADPMTGVNNFTPNTVRGVASFFGENAVISTCERLKGTVSNMKKAPDCPFNVDLIVRAHQMMASGYGFFCNRKLVTIFTASRYQPDCVNKGAVAMISAEGKIAFKVFSPLDEGKNVIEQDEAQKKKSKSKESISEEAARNKYNADGISDRKV